MATLPILRDVSANGQFTDPVKLYSYFNLSISGTWTGTVTCQRSFDVGVTWLDVETWTANAEEFGFEPERDVYYHVGVKLSGSITGTASVRIGQ